MRTHRMSTRTPCHWHRGFSSEVAGRSAAPLFKGRPPAFARGLSGSPLTPGCPPHCVCSVLLPPPRHLYFVGRLTVFRLAKTRRHQEIPRPSPSLGGTRSARCVAGAEKWPRRHRPSGPNSPTFKKRPLKAGSRQRLLPLLRVAPGLSGGQAASGRVIAGSSVVRVRSQKCLSPSRSSQPASQLRGLE